MNKRPKQSVLDRVKTQMVHYIARFRQYRAFPRWKDRIAFYRLSHSIGTTEQVEINIKNAGKNPVILRNNSIDVGVFDYVFFKQYHLPLKPLKAEAVIVDFGSNIGLTIRNLKYLYPESRIFGVELHPQNYQIAIANLRHEKNCSILNGAVWYKDGFVNYEGEDEQSYHCSENISHANQVKSYSILSLFKKFSLEFVDYIKMDIEGAESVIFESDCSWLNMIGSINLELHNGSSLHKYQTILQNFGFTCFPSKKHWSAILAYREK